MTILQLAALILSRDHSFPLNVEFLAESQKFPVSAEFPCFHGILWNSVLAGDKGTKCGIFWSGSGGHRKLIVDMILRDLHDCHSSSNARNIENVELV